MRKQNDKFVDQLISLFLTLGLFYVIYHWINDDAKDKRVGDFGKAGIHGLSGRLRWFKGYINHRGDQIYRKELQKLDNSLITKAIQLQNKASTSEELSGNWFKLFKDDEISGELISGQIRILFYRLNQDNFVMLTVFLKKDDETDKQAKQRARTRIQDIKAILSRG